MVHCGRETSSWSYIHALQETENDNIWSTRFEGTRITQLFYHRQMLQHGRTVLSGMFDMYRDRQCLDTRDQTHSLLSLDSTYMSGRLLVEVDYGIDLCSLLLRTFNASATIPDRTAPYFEMLRLTLGITWGDIFEASNRPPYLKYGEPWFDPARPFDVFASIGLSGTVQSINSVPVVSLGMEVLFIQYIIPECIFLPAQGYTLQAKIGDYVCKMMDTSLYLIAREINGELVFIGPMFSMGLERLNERVLFPKLFGYGSVAFGQEAFARFSLLQWAVTCGCLTASNIYNMERIRPEAGKLPANSLGYCLTCNNHPST
jgi:hypothetical protein